MIKNIFANVVGRFWGILSNYLFIPIYIKLLGIENYAVISFSLILISVMSVMDASLTGTLSREFSKKDNTGNNKKSILNTLELCYLTIAVLVFIIILVFAAPIAQNWIRLSKLDVDYVTLALKFFGLSLVFQFLGNFYLGGLMGLQKQVKANFYQVIWGIFRNGFVIVIIYFNASLVSFFLWQAAVTCIYAFFVRRALIKMINHELTSDTPKFSFNKAILRSVSKFVGGMLLISLVAAINTQLDKITISKLLPIKELGFYNLALTLPQALIVLVNPISIALLPKFTELYTSSQEQKASAIFQMIFHFVGIIVFSIAANIMLFGKELIYLWTGSHELAGASSGYIFFSTLGTGFLAMQIIPFNIAIANGYTRTINIIGIASLFVSIPGYWLSVKYYGPFGATVTWFLIQSVITPLIIYSVKKRFLPELSFFDLYVKEILLTAALSLLVVYGIHWFKPAIDNRYYLGVYLGFTTLSTMTVLSFMLLPLGKVKMIFNLIRQR